MFISSSNYLIVILFFISGCTSWYRTLPITKETSATISVTGTWVKKMQSVYPMNATDYQQKRTQSIVLNQNHTFHKFYYAREMIGDKTIHFYETGSGIYEISGNWILLKTRLIFRCNSEKNKSGNSCESYHKEFTETAAVTDKLKKFVKKSSHKLLYHYHENNIIPMEDDPFYQRSLFGIKDYIKSPHKEDRLFFLTRKIYLKKEFHSHAYFKQ